MGTVDGLKCKYGIKQKKVFRAKSGREKRLL